MSREIFDKTKLIKHKANAARLAKIAAVLGEGGMAMVYKVRHQTLQTQYALKILKVTHEHIRNRMIREGQVQARLRHPNIVSVIDVITVGDSPGLLMEFIEGQPLDELLDDQKLLDHL